MRLVKLFKSNLAIIIVIFLALILRFSVINSTFHDDLYSNASWGEWIYTHGPKDFYSNNVWIYSWPTQPPLISLIYGGNYWLYGKLIGRFDDLNGILKNTHLGNIDNFYIWFRDAYFQETPVKTGSLIAFKVLPILSDIVIAVIIYLLAKASHSKRKLLYPILFLFFPFTWYLSGIWGQYDQISFLFLLVSFLALYSRKFLLSAIFLFISLELKPTSLIFTPLYLWIYYIQKPKVINIITSLLALTILLLGTNYLFSTQNPIEFVNHILIPKIFYKSEFRVSTNAFNFWRIFIGNAALNHDSTFFLLPYKVFGYIFLIPIVIFSLFISKTLSLKNIFLSLYILGLGSYLFVTNMLDRYAFAGVVSLLISSIYLPRFILSFLIIATIFSLNLYHQWYFPPNLDFLKSILIYQNGLITRILSAITTVVFVYTIYQIIKHKLWK